MYINELVSKRAKASRIALTVLFSLAFLILVAVGWVVSIFGVTTILPLVLTFIVFPSAMGFACIYAWQCANNISRRMDYKISNKGTRG